MFRAVLIGIVLLAPFICFSQTLETFAGIGEPGLLNGPKELAQFARPEQMAFDSQGNLYVSDTDNNVIRKIDPDGEVSVYAGSGIIGDVLGDKDSAQFNIPVGLAIGFDDDLYVVDSGNNKVKVVRTNGMVELVAGTGEEGFADGPADQAIFFIPVQICVDIFNNLYIADNNNHRIRKINQTTLEVTTVAGTGEAGYLDGPGSEAMFNTPQGIAIDINSNLYIGDRDNNVIRKINTVGEVTTLAGTTEAGHLDGPGTEALLNGPKGLTIDPFGNIYVADRLNFVVRKINLAGEVSTVAGIPGLSDYLDGEAGENLIGRAVDVVWHPDQYLLITDWENHVIRKLSGDQVTSNENISFENIEFEITPNPSSQFIEIRTDIDAFSTSILNANGQIVSESKNQHRLDISNLIHGIYFVQLIGKNGIGTQKLIVTN